MKKFNEIKSIVFSEYIEITQPEYVFLKLTPNNSIQNNNSDKIAKAINSLYVDLTSLVRIDEYKVAKFMGKEKLVPHFLVNPQIKISYYIYITKTSVDFHFIIPKRYLAIMKEKFSNAWAGITITQVDAIPNFSQNAVKYYLEYSKEDGLSLAADKRDNALLSSNLNIIDILKDDDKVGIFYNFIPTSQFSWLSSYKSTMDKFKKGKPVERNKGNINYLILSAICAVTDLINIFCDLLTFGQHSKKDNEDRFEMFLNQLSKKPSTETEQKGTDQILHTQIMVMSDSEEKVRAINNARALVNSFDAISGDNSLRASKVKDDVDLMKINIGCSLNKCSSRECSNFLALPGRGELEKHRIIDCTKTSETEVPEELRSGVARLGTNTFRGNKVETYMSTDKELQYVTTIQVGPNRAGKTTLKQNNVYDFIKAGECVFDLDFIKNCESSNEVMQAIPKEKCLVIRCNDFNNIQAMAFNEVAPSDDPMVQYDNAKKQTIQLLQLVNMVNDANQPLSAKMDRYLKSAATICFIHNEPFGTIFNILQKHNVRHKLINSIPKDLKPYVADYVDSLLEIDETDKKDKSIVIGTKLDRIDGIIDRLERMKMNTALEMMLKADVSNNINLIDEMQKNQYIVVQMPEDMFSTPVEKDVLCTYWMAKIWWALKIRAAKLQDRSKELKVNFFVDELYQVRNCEALLASMVNQTAKYNFKPIISCHYLGQIPTLKKELAGTSANYMFLKGCNEKVYNDMETVLLPYTFEDMQNMPRYSSLNLINMGEQYAKFITKMPPELPEIVAYKKNKQGEC